MAATMGYGAAPTYVKLASTTVTGSSVASFTVSNIPQGYTDLVLVFNGKDASGLITSCTLQVNGDSGSNYSYTRMVTDGSTSSSDKSLNQTYGFAGYLNTSIGTNIVQFTNYSSTTAYKTIIARTANTRAALITNLWRSTAPITSITLGNVVTNDIAVGSTFAIYGIKSALVPKASGGDVVVNDGTYWYHAFKNTGTFVTNQTLTVDYLVIAGGGSGGYFAGGGGGAGGLRSTVTATGGGGSLESALSLTANTAYPVTIGAGGAGTRYARANGSNTTFSTITSTGGGAGGARATTDVNGVTGGSGGGGGNSTTGGANSGTGGGGTANQGYGGGNGYSDNSSFVASGGGGGAGGAGGSRSGTTAGSGGTGVSIPSIAGATRTGVNGYFAGGGAGGYYASTPGTGGAGGGGNANISGVPNTGGGGGGPVDGLANLTASGGSGLVVVRYAI